MAVDPVVLPLSPGMAAIMASLHARCFAGAAGADWSALAIRTVLESPVARGWLARDEDIPCGLLFVRAAGDDCELLTFGVDPESRRRGYGRMLLHAAAAWARAAQLERLVLEVAVTNRPALALYNRIGFSESGRRKDYYRVADGRVDALLLAARPDTILNEIEK